MRRTYSDSTFLTFFQNFLFLQITIRGRDKRVPSRPIFALHSSTFPLKQGFRVGRLQKVRRGNADVPHENAIFGTKCWKVVQNLVPEIPLYAAYTRQACALEAARQGTDRTHFLRRADQSKEKGRRGESISLYITQVPPTSRSPAPEASLYFS